MRSGFDHEANVLEGRTIEEAKAESARLAAKALAISDHLSRIHYSTNSVVQQNLTAERDRLEWDAAGILARIAEFQGQIEKVREPAPPMTMRARRQAVAK